MKWSEFSNPGGLDGYESLRTICTSAFLDSIVQESCNADINKLGVRVRMDDIGVWDAPRWHYGERKKTREELNKLEVLGKEPTDRTTDFATGGLMSFFCMEPDRTGRIGASIAIIASARWQGRYSQTCWVPISFEPDANTDAEVDANEECVNDAKERLFGLAAVAEKGSTRARRSQPWRSRRWGGQEGDGVVMGWGAREGAINGWDEGGCEETQEVDGVPMRLRLLAVLPLRMLDDSVLLSAEP
ncbi:hypothetical protein B0H13DRAFT_1897165 [Mycena leptocephala]|nr:hypothetical protein B0H13DRAFT_1897165 [Mycena leptocephala]